MSRITKDIAKRVSEAMVSEKRKEAKELDIKFKSEVRKIALEKIPIKVIIMFEGEHKDYIETSSHVILDGHGFSRRWVSIERIPSKGNNTVELTKEQGEKLWKAENKKKEAEQKVDELELEIYNALYYSLKTYKNVEKHFPEAYNYLPQLSTSTALSVNLDWLRQKVK